MERTLLTAGLLALSATASAQGYFPFGEIAGLDVKPTVEINLNPAMLGFVREAAKGANAEAASALAGITGVRVYVYEDIDKNFDDVLKFVDRTSTTLERDGWHPAVRVNEDDEQVRVYVKPVAPDAANPGGTIAGLTVMVTDSGPGGEAVFINIAGVIQPAQLGQIAGAIGMDGVFNGIPGLAVQKAPSPASIQ